MGVDKHVQERNKPDPLQHCALTVGRLRSKKYLHDYFNSPQEASNLRMSSPSLLRGPHGTELRVTQAPEELNAARSLVTAEVEPPLPSTVLR